MKKLLYILLLCPLLFACQPYEEFDDTADGNLEALWTIIDEHYCFLDEKGVDWDGVLPIYRKRLHTGMTQREYFDVCAQMLDTLRDGHVNLSSTFNTSYYRKWWSDYPQDFNLRTLQDNCLEFDYSTTSGIIYKILPDSIGYMYIASFSSPIGESNLDWILHYFKDCKALVIDIRNNGGGMLTNVETLVGRFIEQEICAGFIRHKTGPGHNDFSKWQEVRYQPSDGRIPFINKPIIVVTNRSCFSAANDFVSVMKELPNVKIVGARTGGGSGMPFSSELPNGWSVRFSACPMTDAHGISTEEGIDPSPNCEVHSPDDELAAGIDHIFEFAVITARQLASSESETTNIADNPN